MTASGKKNHCVRPNRVSINTPSKNKVDKRSIVENPEKTAIKKANDKVQIYNYDIILMQLDRLNIDLLSYSM